MIRHNPYVQLISAMVKTGILGYGGGPSVIPLVRHEAVTRYRWVDDDEFGEILAIANTLPGPILTKMSAYLGYKLKKTPGAIVAVLAQIVPSAVAMVALMAAVRFLSTSPVVAGMISAVTPVIAVMLGIMAYEFAERAVKGLGIWIGIPLFVLSFLLLEVVQLHPAIVIVLFLAYGAVHFKTAASEKREKAGKERESK